MWDSKKSECRKTSGLFVCFAARAQSKETAVPRGRERAHNACVMPPEPLVAAVKTVLYIDVEAYEPVGNVARDRRAVLAIPAVTPHRKRAARFLREYTLKEENSVAR